MIEGMISKAFEKSGFNFKDSIDLPRFFKNGEIKPEINSFKDADKPLQLEYFNEERRLTPEEKNLIKDETGWSDKIIDNISSMEEYKLYADAGLEEVEINGNKCLVKIDIDENQKDSMGRTNKERMEQGLAPLDKNGKAIELHHIGQHTDSPLAELTIEEHRGKGNDAVLHDKAKESEIDRYKFNIEKSNHWKARAQGEQ